MALVRRAAALLGLLAVLRQPVEALEIEATKVLNPHDSSASPKCISEELHAHVISLINFDSDSPIIFKVFHPNSTLLHEGRGHKQGHWGFLAPAVGEYRACFEFDAAADKAAQPPAEVDPHTGLARPAAAGGEDHAHVVVDWKTGVNAKDWDEIAKREHLTEVITSLTEVENELRHVYSEMMRMREREEEMRDMSEKVNARVAWMSVVSLSVSVALSLWQIFHLQSFFKKKKII